MTIKEHQPYYILQKTLEDGEYIGEWSGYYITFLHNDVQEIWIKTLDGIRGRAAVSFLIKDGLLDENSIETISTKLPTKD